MVKRAAIVFSIAGLAAACPAFAADVTVSVRTPDGHPLNNAVVMLETTSPHGTASVTNYEISQHDLMFDPFVIVVPAGSTVYFPNRDKVRHHVYSFSPAKRFDLKLFSNLQNRSVIFDRAGIVAIGCNIHDSMQAYIRVVNTPYFARTGADGRVVLRGVPNGASTLRVWHPHLRAPGNELSRSVPISGNMTIPVVGTVRRPVPVSDDY